MIAVGLGSRDEGGKLIPLDVKAGDTILFGKWSGTEIKLEGEDLLIMKESDIVAAKEIKIAGDAHDRMLRDGADCAAGRRLDRGAADHR